MSFSSDWLDLREAADHRARAGSLVDKLVDYLGDESPIKVTDLASGTGSTLRALAPHLANIHWVLTDYDPALLSEASKRAGNNNVVTQQIDLNEPLDWMATSDADVISTSAFLDLVSVDWLARLVDELKKAQLPFYAALSYDGRTVLSPPLPADNSIIEAVNRHQQTDKGFGPALGPNAAEMTIELLEQAGFEVHHAKSDWLIHTDEPEFQSELLKGWVNAACEINSPETAQYEDWLAHRLGDVAAGSLSIGVGHVDVLALPKSG